MSDIDWGLLAPLMTDPTISELHVLGPDRIFVEQSDGQRIRTKRLNDVTFASSAELRDYVLRIVNQHDMHLGYDEPTLAMSSGGDLRIELTAPPVSAEYTMTIVRKAQLDLDLDRLSTIRALTSEAAAVLRSASARGDNIVVYGSTGSGKTTLATALIEAKSDELIIVGVEDARELNWWDKPGAVSLLTSEHRSLRDLFRTALRMRPDSIVVGELRHDEVHDFLAFGSTGQKHLLGTLHARSASAALRRLNSLARQASNAPDEPAMREMIGHAVQLLVGVRRDWDGRRQVASIDRVVWDDKGGKLTTESLYRADGSRPEPEDHHENH